ncbi:MAG: export transporter periplasmic protein LptC [Sphingomonas bacterium]|jgi:lipopolysaccharide export system protein LptC|nr:export transporter periplasmic protein LptC [Sphingomonas bacterium]MDB5718065.1 export transporter periplasmic protein LptC [Sphingomonas bacterium]
MSELADQARSQRQLWAVPGSSHDRTIRLARIVLPLVIGLLVVLLMVAPLTVGRDISFVLSKDRVDVAHERMRVTEALYRGQDSNGQPFALRAASAVQASSRDPVVKMSALSARIVLTDGPATIEAPSGRYDMNSERVMIDGKVAFRSADGYSLDTRDVTVDLKTRKVESGGAVDGTMPLGTFSGSRLSADLNARTVVLDGRARLHIVQGQSRAAR